MAKFPKMDSGEFPHIDTVNVNQWKNEFDYSRFDATQMKLTICAVPWDMGEAHIGNRTISGIGNVVYFETKEKRDAWFDAIPDSDCFRFETKYRELHRDMFIDVPVPFDVAAKYNYLVVEYSAFANDDSYVMYERADGVRKWFWFIREVEFRAPNSTRLHILDDAFQTWIYDVSISGMILERGHAPMFQVKADDYLRSPIDNSVNLLTPDVNYGEPSIARNASEFVFNSGNMYAVVITTSAPGGTWGTKANGDWKTPGAWNIQQQGVPAYFAFAFPAANLSNFLSNVSSSYPQFVQTVKAIAFVSGNLLNLGAIFTFAGTTCNYLSASYVQNELIKLEKADFSYPARYSDIAKLYTYPYAYILVTDDQGRETELHIENTNGKINVESCVSLVFPWLTVNAHLTGIGKTKRRNISFANVSTRNMPIQGNWYETLQSWNIPTFGLYQDAGMQNDYATHYDRAQQAIAYMNEYNSAIASANTDTANTALQTASNSAITAISNASASSDNAATISFNDNTRIAANTHISSQTKSTIDAADQQAALSAATSMVGGVIGAVSNPAGAGASLANAAVGAASVIGSNAIANALTEVQSTQNIFMNAINNGYTDILQNAKTEIQTSAASDITSTGNATATAQTANSVATAKANAERRLDTAQNAVVNQIAQASINAPTEFGAWNYGDLATSRPMGLFANVVTQTDAAISAAGDEMLRYGYAFGRQWNFDGDWNIGKYFTYWKLKDFWVSDLNIPDMYMDKLRFFLFGGVTIWRDPADIGKRTVYENFN